MVAEQGGLSARGRSHPAALLACIAEPTRLRVLAAVVLGSRSADEVQARTGLSLPEVRKCLSRLEEVGAIRPSKAGFEVQTRAFTEAARSAAARPPSGIEGHPREKELSGFFRNGRLTAIPAQTRKRRMVLDFLATRFEPGRYYTESEVNEILEAFHEDFAALRRYLVDEGFMDRVKGRYWRSGGSFEVD